MPCPRTPHVASDIEVIQITSKAGRDPESLCEFELALVVDAGGSLIDSILSRD